MRAPYRVLFVCRENATQSQMAEGWLRHLGGDAFVARSAGTAPRPLHPLATRVMEEAGVLIAAQRGKGVDAIRHERFDVVITLCDLAEESFPALPGIAARRHCPVDDPTFLEDEEGGDIDAFRTARDEIRAVVEGLIAERGAG